MAGDDTPPPPPPHIDITSPYCLGLYDKPGDFITPTRLRGENYDEWAGDIQTALEARRKFVFLYGTITTPSSMCTQADWNTIHAMLISWLMNTIDPEVKSTLLKYKDAKRLWDTLKMRFAIINGPRIQQLKSSIARCEQLKTMSMTSYFGKLTALWEELNNHEPIIAFPFCEKCTDGVKCEKRRDTTRLYEFLMGLCTDFYAQTRTNILSQDPLATLDRAYQLVIQDKRVCLSTHIPKEQPPKVVGFALRTSQGKAKQAASEDKPNKSSMLCTYCKKMGHIISSSFELKVYPDWWPNPSKRGKAGGKGRGKLVQMLPLLHLLLPMWRLLEVLHKTFTADQWKEIAYFVGNTKIPDDRLNSEFDNDFVDC